MLSRKYYVLIARALQEARDAETSRDTQMTAERMRTIDTVAELLASEFKRDNGRFDRDRFLNAAGVAS